MSIEPCIRRIHVFLIHHAKLVRDWLAQARIKLHFVPPYCHLNPIERLLMHRNVTHNRCYATFNEFCDAMLGFLKEDVRMGRFMRRRIRHFPRQSSALSVVDLLTFEARWVNKVGQIATLPPRGCSLINGLSVWRAIQGRPPFFISPTGFVQGPGVYHRSDAQSAPAQVAMIALGAIKP